MSRVVHPDLQRRQRVEPYRPNFPRRTISRYQLVELFVIIGIILAVWGALSLGRVTIALKQAPSGWLESVRIEILDGDSIQSGRQIYRLVGFNTPESGDSAACERERKLAAEARDGFDNSSPAPSWTFAVSRALVRAAPKERANAIMVGYAQR